MLNNIKNLCLIQNFINSDENPETDSGPNLQTDSTRKKWSQNCFSYLQYKAEESLQFQYPHHAELSC